jgi:hypothetical protein
MKIKKLIPLIWIILLTLLTSHALKAQYIGIAAYGEGNLFLLGTDRKITNVYRDLVSWGEWRGNGTGSKIRSSGLGAPLLVGDDNSFFKGIVAGWESLPGGGSGELIVSDVFNGKYWCIGSDQKVWSLNGQQWTPFGITRVEDLAVYNNIIYTIGKTDAKIYKSSASAPRRREWMANGLGKRITLDAKTGTLWCIGTNDDIFKFNGQKWVMYPGNGKGKEIAVCNDVPFVVAADGSVWKGIGKGWQKVIPLSNYENKDIDGYWSIYANYRFLMLPDDGGNGMRWTNDLKVGTVYVFQTNGGKYGKMQILENGPEYRLQFTIFYPEELRDGNFLKCGTCYIDFDNPNNPNSQGDSVDIVWQNRPDVLNGETNTMGIFYLKAINGARMFRIPLKTN